MYNKRLHVCTVCVCVCQLGSAVVVYEGGCMRLRHRRSELTQLQSACCGDEDDDDIDD